MGHCSIDEYIIGPPPDGAWGFAKYKIEIIVQSDTFRCIFNCLDSKYHDHDSIGSSYGRDWELRYDPTFPSEYKVRLRDGAHDIVFDSLKASEIKEFKPWKIIYGRNEPFETTFFYRTTPFGLSPRYIESYDITTLSINTPVILDTVFQFLGINDKYGYNTIDSSIFYEYYSHPPIVDTLNRTGNTFCTPAWSYSGFNGDFYGIKITADSGSSLILEKG